MDEYQEGLFEDILNLVKVNALPGKLINIDTLDGGGNSTQAGILAGYLKNILGVRAVLTAEPTDGEYGKAIRRILRKERTLDPLSLQLLFSVDRGEHVGQLIVPALLDGAWVVTARYALSTLAFGIAEGLPAWQLLAANIAYPWPNLNIVLVVSPEECLRRISIQGRPWRELFEVKETLDKTLAAYSALAVDIPNVVLVDGTGSPAEVFERIKSVVRRNFLLEFD